MSSNNGYLLLFRGIDWHRGLSPEEIQNVMNQWKAWYERLSQEGKVKAGQPLEGEGKVVTGKKGRVIADGPFAEAKEAVGGYFLLQVESMEAAVAIARECPSLDHGGIVEVRPIADICPVAKECGEMAGVEKELATVSA